MAVRVVSEVARWGSGDETALLVGSMWRGRRLNVGSICEDMWVLLRRGIGGDSELVRLEDLGRMSNQRRWKVVEHNSPRGVSGERLKNGSEYHISTADGVMESRDSRPETKFAD